MNKYKILEPFSKGLFNGLIRKQNRENVSLSKGYVLLDDTDQEHGVYLHNTCGMTSKRRYENIRTGKVKCKDCMLLRFQKEADMVGYELVEQLPPGDIGSYRCFSCNQHNVFQISHVRENNVRCKHCVIEKWKLFAINKGYVWIKSTTKNRSIYKHTGCGREIDVQNGSVPNKCILCQQDKYRSEAIAQGYTWLGCKSRTTHNYTHNACGSLQTKQLGNMRDGKVACSQCEESWYTKPSSLYLFKMTCGNFSWLKAGISIDTDRRLKRYEFKDVVETKLIFETRFETGKQAVLFEKRIQKQFKEFLLCKKIMQEKMGNGFTECYDFKIEEILLRELRQCQ